MSTEQPNEAHVKDPRPIDLPTMRETVACPLGPDAAPDALPPATAEVDTLTGALRGHLELLIPEIERAVGPRPKSVAQHCALACVGEARGRLRAEPQPGIYGAVAHARRLARVLSALCDHHERIRTGGETPERAALRRLGDHSAKCPACRAVDDQGANANLPCSEGDRLYDEWRMARRGTASTLRA
jgi:hypothetical protein